MIEKVNISQVMNQYQIVTDTNYVYVELADGSQGKIKKSDLANVMNTLIGGLFPKLFSTPSAGNVKGFIIRTAISTAQYRAIRCHRSCGYKNDNLRRGFSGAGGLSSSRAPYSSGRSGWRNNGRR